MATGATTSKNVGDKNGRGEAYVFGIDGDPTTLCYVLTVEKIAPATGAHIHEGPRGRTARSWPTWPPRPTATPPTA